MFTFSVQSDGRRLDERAREAGLGQGVGKQGCALGAAFEDVGFV